MAVYCQQTRPNGIQCSCRAKYFFNDLNVCGHHNGSRGSRGAFGVSPPIIDASETVRAVQTVRAVSIPSIPTNNPNIPIVMNSNVTTLAFRMCDGVTTRGLRCKKRACMNYNGLSFCRCHIPIGAENSTQFDDVTAPVSVNIDDDCPICYNRLGDADIVQTNCKHLFHKHCMDTWLRNNSQCPLCRRRTFVSRHKETRSIEIFVYN